jgi:hypothetical protein
MEADQPNRIRAIDVQQVRLVDEQGNVRGFFGIDANGNAGLILSDGSGTAQIVISVSEAGQYPMVKIQEGEGHDRITLALTRDGAAIIQIRDKHNRSQMANLTLAVDTDGQATGIMCDNEGNVLWGRPASGEQT